MCVPLGLFEAPLINTTFSSFESELAERGHARHVLLSLFTTIHLNTVLGCLRSASAGAGAPSAPSAGARAPSAASTPSAARAPAPARTRRDACAPDTRRSCRMRKCTWSLHA